MSYCHRLTFKKKSYEVFLKRQRPQRKRKSYFFFLCILLCSCYVKKKWTKRTNEWIFFLEKGGKEAFQIILFIFWRKTRFSVGTTRHKKFIRGVWYATRKASFQVCWMLQSLINILSVVAMQHDSLILFLNNPVPLILPEERWVVAVLPAHDLAALLSSLSLFSLCRRHFLCCSLENKLKPSQTHLRLCVHKLRRWVLSLCSHRLLSKLTDPLYRCNYLAFLSTGVECSLSGAHVAF